MIAYEFYIRDQTNGRQLVGILPERRKTLERITPQSITNWGKQILGDDMNLNSIFYVTTTIDEETGEIHSFPSVF